MAISPVMMGKVISGPSRSYRNVTKMGPIVLARLPDALSSPVMVPCMGGAGGTQEGEGQEEHRKGRGRRNTGREGEGQEEHRKGSGRRNTGRGGAGGTQEGEGQERTNIVIR